VSLFHLVDTFCHFPVLFRMRGSAAGQLISIHTTPRLQGDQTLWVTQYKNQSTFIQSGKTALHAVTAPTNAQFYYCAFVANVNVCKYWQCQE
jgi:hypothetical protein